MHQRSFRIVFKTKKSQYTKRNTVLYHATCRERCRQPYFPQESHSLSQLLRVPAAAISQLSAITH